jgi:uncharacterized metal-binding protein YceD (DUF177 family)
MKLSVSSLKFPHRITVTNEAPWVLFIAQHLNANAPPAAGIAGELVLKQDSAGFIHVGGSLSAAANLPCDRCGSDLDFPIAVDVKATFRPPYESSVPREMSLSEEDFEVYFIENGELDIEVLVHDTLQCALPLHILCENAGQPPCAGPDQGLTASAFGESERESPFAILKNLKKS